MTGIELIKKWEGLRLEAYLCSAGVPTIGYGHTKGVKLEDTCTEEQADEWLREDMREAQEGINKYLKVSVTRNQLDALTSFVFNLGIGNFKSSTLLKLLNEGKYLEASNQFPRWNRANGKIVAGLTNRRLNEKQVFNS